MLFYLKSIQQSVPSTKITETVTVQRHLTSLRSEKPFKESPRSWFVEKFVVTEHSSPESLFFSLRSLGPLSGAEWNRDLSVDLSFVRRYHMISSHEIIT